MGGEISTIWIIYTPAPSGKSYATPLCREEHPESVHIARSMLYKCWMRNCGKVFPSGVYKVPYSIPLEGGGGFIKPVWEEYKVLKEGREYHGCGEEYNVDKKEGGSKILFPII